MNTILDTGCHIVAHAVKSAKVDVVAAYPITPQTSIVEEVASMVERGELDCRFLPVEGEHSAMAACVAAATVGARTFTATSSQGLLYMHEVLHMASGCRLPVVMANVNRAVFAPWSIWVDHQDSLSQRDTGWLQYYCSSLQEVYNTILQAFKVAEQVHLPVMVNFDGFVLSHCSMAIQVPDQHIIDEFLPPLSPEWIFDTQNPVSYASVTPPEMYAMYREQLHQAQNEAKALMIEAAKQYKDLTGMWNGDLFEAYQCQDAEIFILSMGSMASEMRLTVDMLRSEGIKAGALRLRVYRPFPKEELSQYLPKGSKLVVLDRNYAFGMDSGILYAESQAALFGRSHEVEIYNKIMGIGGLDLTYQYMAQEVKKIIGVEEG
ncbi:MAG: transketolase C-terminal domain-containing protein [Bacillota bacterium]|jgi:pyruvate/2-oxoacid:ferredoxin oxidoreductase alpha subunit